MRFMDVHGQEVKIPGQEEIFRASHAIGVLRIGEDRLFFRTGLRWYVVPYADVDRCFRRVRSVPARLCCGRGSLDMESLVICRDGQELAEIQMPGTRAAVMALEELKGKMPGVTFSRPEPEASA